MMLLPKNRASAAPAMMSNNFWRFSILISTGISFPLELEGELHAGRGAAERIGRHFADARGATEFFDDGAIGQAVPRNAGTGDFSEAADFHGLGGDGAVLREGLGQHLQDAQAAGRFVKP